MDWSIAVYIIVTGVMVFLLYTVYSLKKGYKDLLDYSDFNSELHRLRGLKLVEGLDIAARIGTSRGIGVSDLAILIVTSSNIPKDCSGYNGFTVTGDGLFVVCGSGIYYRQWTPPTLEQIKEFKPSFEELYSYDFTWSKVMSFDETVYNIESTWDTTSVDVKLNYIDGTFGVYHLVVAQNKEAKIFASETDRVIH